MQRDFAPHSMLLFFVILTVDSCAMQPAVEPDDYTPRAVQFVANHKVAIVATTALCALGAYKFITREPKIKHPITVLTKNPIAHLQCTPGYLQNFDKNKSKTASATHAYEWSQFETIDITNFIEKGRVFLVEGKKKHELIVTLIKIASTQNDFDVLETAIYQQEKKISIYSKYKHEPVADALVDCIIEYPKTVVCAHAKPALEVLKKSE